MNYGTLLHGGDYNPEQWLDEPEALRIDIERFLEAGINTVSVGIFSWAKLEPAEGQYDFDWLADIIDELYRNGISVNLATPSGARPRWLAEKYPEVLRTNEMGQKYIFGERHNHCLTSPVYRKKVRMMNMELAKRFGDHPAVRMWHLSNEYGGYCYCSLCQNAFREYLKEKYQTIDALNKAWWTSFWSHTYDRFDQVEAPSPLGERSVIGLILDWKRFMSNQTIDFMSEEIRALRDAGTKKPVTTNMMYRFDDINYYRMAEKLDLVSYDNYPSWHKREEYITAMDSAFQLDLMRGLKRAPFLLMESCPGATNWQPISKLKRPGMIECMDLQAIAHGSEGALYFQMRKGRGSMEMLHGAVIDHYEGNDTRNFREIVKAGESLAKLAETAGTVSPAEVAVIYDWDNRWAIEASYGPRNQGMFYQECCEKSHRAFRRLGLNVDIIDQSVPLTGYKIVAAPLMYVFHEGFAEKVREYIAQGGTFILTYWSGVVDENDLCFMGGRPHGLMDVFGLRAEEIDGLYDGDTNRLVPAGFGSREYSCQYLCDVIRPSTAETLMVYGDDFYAGNPALTVNRYGDGLAYYLCADAEQGLYDEFYEKLVCDANVSRVMGEIPYGVEVTSRESEEKRYIFIQNYNRYDVTVALPEGEVILGDAAGEMKPLQTIVVRQEK